MNIFKIDRFINDLDNTMVERRTNESTGDVSYWGVIEITDGVSMSEVGSVQLQSIDIYSATNEWRLKHADTLRSLLPKLNDIYLKNSQGEKSFLKRVFERFNKTK